jgi:hypothetical protein
MKKLRLRMAFYILGRGREGSSMSPLLGYVFWHKPRSGVSSRAYERRLLAFQRSLRAHPPEGLVDALTFRESALPWQKRRSTAYEDWYLVRDFRSLGALNEAAVDEANRRSHDEVAEEASAVAGGLYGRLRGDLRLQDSLYATWVRKPAPTPYEEFFVGLSRMTEGRRTDLWQRQMVLGPAPEFCVHSESPLEFPKGFRPAAVRVRSLAESEP